MWVVALVAFMVGCSMTGLLFVRYVAFTSVPMSVKCIVLLGCFIVAAIPVLVGYQVENWLGRFYFIYRYTLYFIYIAVVILFTLTIIRDVVWLGVHLICPDFPSLMFPRLGGVNVITVVAAILLSGYALYEGIKVPSIKNITVISDKINQGKKIVLLPDLHLHRTLPLNKLKGIVARVNAQDADAILLIGDMIDDDINRIQHQLAVLKGLKAKTDVYFVSGNHEVYHRYQKSMDALTNLGFQSLDNTGQEISPDLFIGGVPDVKSGPYSGHIPDLKKAFAQAPVESFKILMSHMPTDFKHYPFDLEVSGHTHGGQVFPFMFFVYAHTPFVSGLYNLNEKAQIYVSRGAGQWGPQMRFLAPAEITVLHIQKEQ